MSLANVKVGDVLAVYSRYHSGPQKRTVHRVTATQVITGMDRFNKRSGRLVGSSQWDRSLAEPWTDYHDDCMAEAAKDAKRMRIAADLRAVGWLELDLATLQAVAAIVLPKDSA